MKCNSKRGKFPLKRNGSCNSDMVKSEDERCCENCPPCAPGHGKMRQPPCLNSVPVPCMPCEEGTYSSKEDTESCSICTDCDADLQKETETPCTSISNTICGRCKTGYYEINNSCYKCATDSSLDQCKSSQSTSLNLPLSGTTTSGFTMSPKAKSDIQTEANHQVASTGSYVMVGAVSIGVIALLLLIVALIFYVIRKRHRQPHSGQTTRSTSQISIVKNGTGNEEQLEPLRNGELSAQEVPDTDGDLRSFKVDVTEPGEVQNLAVPNTQNYEIVNLPKMMNEQKESKGNYELQLDHCNGSSCEIFSTGKKAHFGKKQPENDLQEEYIKQKVPHYTNAANISGLNDENLAVSSQTARERHYACCHSQEQTRNNAFMGKQVTMLVEIPPGSDINLSLQNNNVNNN